ncbi:MAG TPA: tetratricopeptide repeat protein, partial [Streptomyces sp.]
QENIDGEAAALDSLGYIDHHSGQYDRAIRKYRQALALQHRLGNTNGAADTLDNLGHSHVALGGIDEARTAWQESLELYRAQGRADAVERVLRQLDTLIPAHQRS